MINTRSPHYLTIPWVSPLTAALATEITIKLYFWHGLKSAVPVTESYSITKTNYTSSVDSELFNISNIADGFIEFTPDLSDTQDESCHLWCKSEVYYTTIDEDDDGVAQLETTDLCIRGYGYGTEGVNFSKTLPLLFDGSIFRTSYNSILYLPVYCESLQAVTVVSSPESEINDSYNFAATTDTDGIIRYIKVDISNLTNDERITITVNGETKTVIALRDYKFTSHDVIFCNKYGCQQSIQFRKERKDSITITGEEYETAYGQPRDSIHQFNKFNVQARTKMKLQTGFIPEQNNELIKQLLLSESVYLRDGVNFIPINISSSSVEYKTRLNDKLINYQIEFEMSYNEINNI